VIRIGTHGGALAQARAEVVAEALRAHGGAVELVVVDKDLREALAAAECDAAVHAYPDLPVDADPRVTLAAVPRREDPRDALCARDGLTLGELPAGSTVGTASELRQAQLDALGLGLDVLLTSEDALARFDGGELGAVVLARADLAHLGRLDAITEALDPLQVLPAPAQGALAVECRADDVDTERLLRTAVDDPSARATTAAERALLAALDGGIVAALAEVVEDLTDEGRVVERLSLRGVAATGTGELLRASAVADIGQAEQMGRELAAELLDLGAASLADRGDRGMGSG
jgi:hydroxymethylbilane synthase